jgi:hypothetical protein
MLKFISLIVFINVLWHGQCGKAPTEDIDEDEIFYYSDPMTIAAKALKKNNIKY